MLLGGTVPTAVPGAVGAAGPGGGPRLARPRLARPGAAAARHDGEQSGEAGPRLQAPGAAAAGAQRAAGAGLPGGRVVERGAGQLPQRAALRQEAALRLPRGARGHARRHRHLLLAQQRGAARGLHLAPAAAAAQVRAAGPRDPRHRLPRRRHLHQGRLPAGGGERGAACDGRLRAGVVGASRRVATGRAVGPRAGGRGMETWGGGVALRAEVVCETGRPFVRGCIVRSFVWCVVPLVEAAVYEPVFGVCVVCEPLLWCGVCGGSGGVMIDSWSRWSWKGAQRSSSPTPLDKQGYLQLCQVLRDRSSLTLLSPSMRQPLDLWTICPSASPPLSSLCPV